MKLAFVWETAHPQHTALEKEFTAIAQKVLRDHNQQAVALDVVLVSDDRIRMYNKTYRGHDTATDVLSFAFSDSAPFPSPREEKNLGQIIINLEDVSRTARKRHVEEKDIAHFLFVHGLLHVLGYDHMKKGDEKKMRDAEKRYCGKQVWYQ